MPFETIPGNRGYIWAMTEVTYGSDPGLAITNVQYVENFTSNPRRVMTPRTGMSPYRPGWRPVRTSIEPTWSCDIELGDITLAGTDTVRPQYEPFLRAAGFDAGTYSASTSNCLVYNLLSHGHGSCALEEYYFVEDELDSVGTQYLGCRADWTININGSERWMMSLDASAKTGTQAAGTTPATATYVFAQPATGDKTVVSLKEYDGDTAYAGLVLSASISGNMGKTVVSGLSGAVAGPAKVVLNPTAGITVELIMEQVEDADWNPIGWMDTAGGGSLTHELQFSYTNGDDNMLLCGGTTAASADMDYFGVALQDLEHIGDQDGSRVWKMTFSGLYPEVGTDEGGIVPANNLQLVFQQD